MRRCLLCACAIALIPAFVRADDIFMKGGGRISGRILSRTEKSIEVDVGAGTVTLPMTSVVRIEEKRSSLDEYHERAAALDAGDVNGWLQLARWASSQGLGTQALRANEQVLAADPGNAAANQALGRVQLDGRWVTEEESYQARGFVQFEGEWMTPAEQAAILRERDAAIQAEQARLDAERRVQDAEARAREAEAAVADDAGYPIYWGGYTAWGPGPPVWPTRPIARPPARPARPRVR